MEKLEDIKKHLEHGDYKTIHKMSGVSLSTISKMFMPEGEDKRNVNTPAGAKVLKAARQIIKSRQALLSSEEQTKDPAPISLPLEFGT